MDPLAESILYVCALIADRPRAIDRYIDYFGERRPGHPRGRLQSAILTSGVGRAVGNHSAETYVGKAWAP